MTTYLSTWKRFNNTKYKNKELVDLFYDPSINAEKIFSASSIYITETIKHN
jgi:hypothetical protein